MTDLSALRAKLESDGESIVREKLASGVYGVLTDPFSDVPKVEAWLSEIVSDRNSDSESRKESRENESLSIAKSALASANDANRLASEANDIARLEAAAAARSARYAMYAAAIAAVAALSAAKDDIIRLIFG
jgi:hypothetical protein